MSVRWDEVLSSINTSFDKIEQNEEGSKVTLATFDAQDGLQFDIIRDSVPAKKMGECDKL